MHNAQCTAAIFLLSSVFQCPFGGPEPLTALFSLIALIGAVNNIGGKYWHRGDLLFEHFG